MRGFPVAHLVYALLLLLALHPLLLSQPGVVPRPDDGRVVIHTLLVPDNLNPLTSSDASSQEIGNYIYETLISTDPFTLETIPWIAEELPRVSADRLNYDFRIRRDAKFSDGRPVTGRDFIFYLKVLKNPLVADATPTREYYERVDSALLIDGDPYRLRVVMSRPYYLGEQWAGGLYALPRHIWDPNNLNEKISFAELNNRDEQVESRAMREFATFFEDPAKAVSKKYLVGSGPYVFDMLDRDNSWLRIKRNSRYWNGKHPYGSNNPREIVWYGIGDGGEAQASLLDGEIDLMPRGPQVQSALRRKLDAIGIKAVDYDFPAYNYIGYNGENLILRDAEVRRALAHAVDRDAIIEKVYLGNARSIQSPIYYKRPEYDSTLTFIEFDLEKARKILADAGWRDSDGDGILDKVIDGVKTDFRFSITTNSGNRKRIEIATMFAHDLKKIGVEVSTTSLDWATFLKNTRDGEYDAYIGGWVMGVTEGDLYQIWHSESAEERGSNYVKFRNREVDSLIEAIREEADFERRRVMYVRIQRIIHQEQPYNFLISERFLALYRDRFSGVQFFAPRPCYNIGWWQPVNTDRR